MGLSAEICEAIPYSQANERSFYVTGVDMARLFSLIKKWPITLSDYVTHRDFEVFDESVLGPIIAIDWGQDDGKQYVKTKNLGDVLVEDAPLVSCQSAVIYYRRHDYLGDKRAFQGFANTPLPNIIDLNDAIDKIDYTYSNIEKDVIARFCNDKQHPSFIHLHQ